MKSHLLACFAIILAILSFLSCSRSVHKDNNSITDLQTVMPVDTLYTIPFQITGDMRRILLEAKINNKTKTFMLDSEFPYHCIDCKFVLSLFDTTNHTSKMIENGFTRVFCNHPININLQNLVCHSDTFELMFPDHLNTKEESCGIVGRPFFEKSVVCINFDVNRIYILNKFHDNFNGYASAEYIKNKEDHRILTLKFPTEQDSISANLILDFGAPFSDIDKDIKKHIKIPTGKVNPLNIGAVLLNRAVAIKYKIDVEAGNSQTGEVIEHPFENWGCNGGIGMDIIKQYNMIIDYQHNRIYYTPNEYYKKMTKQ